MDHEEGVVEIRELRYFLAVAEELSFSRAADRLHIAQPSVSQLVARLERELGVRLFDRTSRVVRLTAAGETLLPHARRVLDEVERTRRVAAELVGGSRGCIRVGAIESMGWRLQRILSAFAEAHTGVTVSVTTDHTAAKLAALRAGELDVAFVRSAVKSDDIDLLDLWDEPVLVVLPQHHGLAARSTVPLAALSAMPVILSPQADRSETRDRFFELCREAGFRPNLGPPYRGAEDALANIAASVDTWMPLHATHNALIEGGQVPGVAVRPFADLNLVGQCHLAWSSTGAPPTVESFVDTVRSLRDRGVFTPPAG